MTLVFTLWRLSFYFSAMNHSPHRDVWTFLSLYVRNGEWQRGFHFGVTATDLIERTGPRWEWIVWPPKKKQETT
jgi:hypothetical protein